LFKLQVAGSAETGALLTAEAYEAFIAAEEAKG
jgi:hypothetical protein